MATIDEVAEKMDRRREKTEDISKKFEGIESISTDSTVKESFLTKKIEAKKPEKVAGIDGGIVKKRYSTADIVAVRAVAALFNFERDKVSAEYFPSKNPRPDFSMLEQQDAESLERKAEQLRLEKEVKTTLDVLDEAGMALMDGSIVPSYLENTKAVEMYNSLFNKANPGQLVGVVEDSHGLKMAGLLREKLDIEIEDLRDTLLMDQVLNSSERSFVRRYSDSPVEHPVLQKIDDEKANKLNTFYVKLSEKDLPLRIDFYGSEDEADSIASKLIYMKSSNKYTIPSPVLEADKRAKISEKLIERLEKKSSFKLRRRDRRMF